MRRYLSALETDRPGRGVKRTADAIGNRITKVDELLVSADPLSRVHLTQERIELHAEYVRVTNGNHPDLSQLERDFVRVVRSYGDRNGITYAAWRQVGVDAKVLELAGIHRAEKKPAPAAARAGADEGTEADPSQESATATQAAGATGGTGPVTEAPVTEAPVSEAPVADAPGAEAHLPPSGASGLNGSIVSPEPARSPEGRPQGQAGTEPVQAGASSPAEAETPQGGTSHPEKVPQGQATPEAGRAPGEVSLDELADLLAEVGSARPALGRSPSNRPGSAGDISAPGDVPPGRPRRGPRA